MFGKMLFIHVDMMPIYCYRITFSDVFFVESRVSDAVD